MAGSRAAVDILVQHLRSQQEFADLEIKESLSQQQPFHRMLVKIKREIIAFGVDDIDPAQATSPKLPPSTLKKWLDEGRPLELLDVRNEYEIRLGTFHNARSLAIDNFRQFPEAVRQLPEESKSRPVVMFCTGGIRCEKAGPLLQRAGFTEVYQLDGGILKYFDECGGVHYDGDCFVFDQRVSVDSRLQETNTTQCYACQMPLTVEEQTSDQYEPGVSCPHCFRNESQRRSELLAERNRRIRQLATPLPGSVPYDNIRPLHIPADADGLPIIDYLARTFVFVKPADWLPRFEAGLITLDGQPIGPDAIVHAGERYEHTFPATIEPPVNANVGVLHEDQAIVVVHKPSSLPMHPCGRFNRNTLSYLLGQVYHPQQLRLAHRLDANTSGVVVFSRTRQIAGKLQPQFAAGTVQKRYRCRILGSPPEDQFESQAPISIGTMPAGGKTVDAKGLAAHTQFRVLQRLPAGQTLIEATPITGRSNQIRIHLWDLGWPIVGDPMYRPQREIVAKQTLSPGDPPMCLHAHRLRFVHPVSGQTVEFEAPLPDW